MSRRGPGDGSVRRREDGRWEGRVSEGYGPDGRRRVRSVYAATRREAQERVRELLARRPLARGAAEHGTVGELLDRYLAHDARARLRPATVAGLESADRTWIRPHLGRRVLGRLQARDLEAWLGNLRAAGASPRTQLAAYQALSAACQWAVRRGELGASPLAGVARPRVERAERRTWTVDDARRALAAVEGDRLEALLVLLLATGLRIGEALALRWSEVDLEAGRLRVVRSETEVGGELVEGGPKTAAGRRAVALAPSTVAALRAHRARQVLEDAQLGDDAQARAQAEGRVFRGPRGGPLRARTLRARWWLPLLERTGLPAISFHELRHTSATLLLEAGVHPRVVQERLGHSSVAITLDLYSHVAPHLQDAAAAALEDALGPSTALPLRPRREPRSGTE